MLSITLLLGLLIMKLKNNYKYLSCGYILLHLSFMLSLLTEEAILLKEEDERHLMFNGSIMNALRLLFNFSLVQEMTNLKNTWFRVCNDVFVALLCIHRFYGFGNLMVILKANPNFAFNIFMLVVQIILMGWLSFSLKVIKLEEVK